MLQFSSESSPVAAEEAPLRSCVINQQIDEEAMGKKASGNEKKERVQ